MRSKQQNKLRRRISRRHKGGKPLEQLKSQVEEALHKLKDFESVLRGVLNELTSAEEVSGSEAQPSLGSQRDRVMGMHFDSLDTPEGDETPGHQSFRSVAKYGLEPKGELVPEDDWQFAPTGNSARLGSGSMYEFNIGG